MISKPNNIDEYISGFSKEVQEILEQVRQTIRDAEPTLEEKISYAIPTFTLNKVNVVHFAGFKNHVGFYPAPSAGEAFMAELAGYKSGKGSVQFPINKPMPLELISKMVKFRVDETLQKQLRKNRKSDT